MRVKNTKAVFLAANQHRSLKAWAAKRGESLFDALAKMVADGLAEEQASGQPEPAPARRAVQKQEVRP